MLKVTVVLACERCGLLTPTVATVPDGTDPRRPFVMQTECHHCDWKMEMSGKVQELYDLAKKQQQDGQTV